MNQNIISLGGKNIELLKGIGKGTYGSVYLIKYRNSLKAIKIISTARNEGIKSLREIDIMTKLIHPNIVRSDGIVVGINLIIQVGIIMDLANTDLGKLIPHISISEKIKILFDISNGVKYLHDSGYIHLDIKPMNVLIFGKDKRIVGKLTDFGLSLLLEHNNEKYFPHELVTITYRAPEILKGNFVYTKKSDIWSLGILFLEVLSNKTIYPNCTKDKVSSTIKKKFSAKTIDETLNVYLSGLDMKTKKNSIALIKIMLDINSNTRPSIDQVVYSSLFKDTGHVTVPVGKTIYKSPLMPRKCDIIYYYGFDIMLKLSLKFQIKLETFFIASDIYQRSLSFAHKLTGKFEDDWPNVALLASSCLYMAIKMIEPYNIKTDKLVTMTLNIFKSDDIIRTEAALVQMFEGMIYPKNLYTETNGHKSLLYVFESLRNCHIYHRIDLNEWKKLNKLANEPFYDKYISLSDFVKDTTYYNLMMKQEQNIYISQLYKSDTR